MRQQTMGLSKLTTIQHVQLHRNIQYQNSKGALKQKEKKSGHKYACKAEPL